MNLQQRISALAAAGNSLQQKLELGKYDHTIERAYAENAWFTPANTRKALCAIVANYLDENNLRRWIEKYKVPDAPAQQTIAIVMAGNIPLAGFHDLLAVLITGNRAMIKSSSKDEVLTRLVVDELIAAEPAFAEQIVLADKLKDFDKVIATGSNNTRRYFEYYFRDHPHIIRHNRNSVGVLTGSESITELKRLGDDIFTYFGLGCRNVSRLFVPKGYDFTSFFEAIQDKAAIMDHHKYQNNYLYHKSIMLLNKEKHFDNGFLLVKEADPIASPMSCLYYTQYENLEDVKARLDTEKENIQVVVGHHDTHPEAITFGTTQQPSLWDYADKVDTVRFLVGE